METVYKNKARGNINLTDEERAILNSPTYMHRCTICKIYKPNTEYTKDISHNGRQFISQCKACRAKYSKNRDKKLVRLVAKKNRNKNRINTLFSSAKGNAARRNLEFSIVKQDILDLLDSQKGLCYYTSKPMLTNLLGEENSDNSISIDRKNSKLGYTRNNIVLCRWIVNKIKLDLDIEDFLQIAEDIKQNLKWQPLDK